MVWVMTTLITGGTGALGLELARLLPSQGEDLILFDAAPRERLAAALAPAATVFRGDLSNWADVVAALRRYAPQRIFHLAALLPAACERNPAAAYAANVQGTFHVLEAARLLNPCRLILASSAAAVARPASAYGATKRCAEVLARSYHEREGLDIRAVRLLPLIGLGFGYVQPPARPGQGGAAQDVREQFLYGHISTVANVMLQEATSGRPWSVPVPAGAPLHAMYRRDAAHALAAIAAADGTRLQRRIYSVAGPAPVPTLGDLAAALSAVAPGAGFTFDDAPAAVAWVAAAHEASYSDDEARADWGWAPRFTVDKLARDAVAEVQRRPHLYAGRTPRNAS